ncbi:probable protein s-acyltransferase 15 [Phtheirospermum japonicum]|uniref:S-acyltransferase n=1 Tax=Phtheirospermum japonicum TaxID=374723 RepID=A0A830C6Y8_9LAMI|nr:probable protein s-acyltransferase 15 [Phtheirospermum japonicum]
MKIKKFLSIPVLAAFILFGFIYYVTVFVFIEDWYGIQSSAGLLNTLIFSVLACLCFFSLLVCVLKDPGGVPSGYVPDVEDNQGPDQELKRNGMHLKRCDKCNANKPPRAHHCRVCRRNYKSFLLLVFYSTAASTYSTTVIICYTLKKNWDFAGSESLKSFHVLCGLVSICSSLVLGTLLAWHIYLTSRNMTTIEPVSALETAGARQRHWAHPSLLGSSKSDPSGSEPSLKGDRVSAPGLQITISPPPTQARTMRILKPGQDQLVTAPTAVSSRYLEIGLCLPHALRLLFLLTLSWRLGSGRGLTRPIWATLLIGISRGLAMVEVDGGSGWLVRPVVDGLAIWGLAIRMTRRGGCWVPGLNRAVGGVALFRW